MVIQAFRYSLVDADEAYDEFLQPILVPMLHTMLQDDNLDIKRLALTTLNSAAHNKPDIILTNLGSLLPLVMRESHVRKELIREVEMGPFKHKVDDGLEVRKVIVVSAIFDIADQLQSAYETLYALMETSFSRMSVVEFFDRVLAGLEDEHDIRVLCNLMLAKLIVLDPDETQRRLDKIAEAFRKIISFKPRETAVKQEVEKAEEASKGCLKVSVALHASFPAAAASATSGQHLEWRNYWEWIRRDFGAQVRQIENAAK
jgi:cullin-associated NEDD8-dissociated protein 1